MTEPTEADRQQAREALPPAAEADKALIFPEPPEGALLTCYPEGRLAELLAAARQEGADAEALRWATGLCSAHQRPEPECPVCNGRETARRQWL